MTSFDYFPKKSNINQWSLSDSGGYLAVALSSGGSDWLEIRVRDLYKQKDLADRVDRVKFSSIVWWNNGFFYARYKNSGETSALGGQQLYYHKLGQSQNDDILLISTPAEVGYSDIRFQKTSNGRYLVINKNEKLGGAWYNIIAYKDLTEGLYDDWKYVAQTADRDKAFFNVIDYADSGFIVYNPSC